MGPVQINDSPFQGYVILTFDFWRAFANAFLQVAVQKGSSLAWSVSDFEALLEALPGPDDKECDLSCIHAHLGEDLAVVLLCPRLFRI